MALMPAHKRDQRIGFQRAADVNRSALGTKVAASWSEIGRRLASVRYGTSAERRESRSQRGEYGAESAVQAATFRTLADSLTRTVTVQDRITHDGLTYDITGIAVAGRAEIEFTATARRG